MICVQHPLIAKCFTAPACSIKSVEFRNVLARVITLQLWNQLAGQVSPNFEFVDLTVAVV